jgi:hypothetical protein
VQLLAVYGGDNHYYREELLDAFPSVRFGDQLQLEFFKQADHMFTSPVVREPLIDLVVGWAAGGRFANGRGTSVSECR